MTRGLAVLGSAVFFLIAPTTVAGVVPWWISLMARPQAPFFDLQLIRWFGVVLILLGITSRLPRRLRGHGKSWTSYVALISINEQRLQDETHQAILLRRPRQNVPDVAIDKEPWRFSPINAMSPAVCER